MARVRNISEVDYNAIYRQAGVITDNPSELKAKPARRVITNLTPVDFDLEREPPLFHDSERVRTFFAVHGKTVELKTCPACRTTYDTESDAHVCEY